MAKNTIVIRNLTTGAGIAGLSVKLKKYTSQGFVDFQTASEIPALPGVYSFDDVPYSRYKLFINETEDSTWDNGSPDGRFFGGRISELVTDLDMSNHRIINVTAAIDPYDAVNKSQLDTKLNKFGDTMSGNLNLSGNRITGLPTNQNELTDPSDAASVALTIGINSYTGQNYLNIPAKTIFVHPSFSDIAGKKSSSIQGAINYAQSQSPSIENQFNIMIFPTSNSSGYAKNLTLQPFIHLSGIGKIIVSGTITGGNPNSHIQNINFRYLGNLTFNNLKAKSCSFVTMNDDTGYILTFNSCVLNNCNLINVGQAEFHPTIVSGGGNVFINCVSNIPCTLKSGDKGSIASLEDVTLDFS